MKTDSLIGVIELLATTGVAVVYLLVIGAPLRLALGAVARPVRGLGVTLGLGLAATGVVVTLCYVLLGDALLPVLPLAACALAALVALVLLDVVRRARGTTGTARLLHELAPTRWDGIALGLSIIVLAPLLVHGSTYWTALANDFPNYAASAEVWVTSSGHGATPFLTTHPDAYGAFQVHRAEYEKPMVTGMLVALAAATRTPAAGLLATVVGVSFFILIATLLPLVARTLKTPPLVTTLAVAVPSMSIVPMSRLFDAQIGQTVAVALVAVLLAALVATSRGGRGHLVWHVCLAGLLGTAAVGSNPTLVLGTSIGTAALLGWLVVGRQPWRAAARTTAGAAAVGLALSAPVLGWYVSSLRNQTTGELGYEIPLASPFSLIGMQVDLRSAPPLGQAAVEWAVVLLAAGFAYLAAKRRKPGLPATGALAAATLANGALIVAVNGITSYATHKWLAVAVALVMPFVLARLAETVPSGARGRSTTFLALLGTGSAALGVAAAAAVPVVVPRAAYDLADDERLAIPTLNVALDDIYQNSLVPLLVPADEVVVAGPTYARSSVPRGSTFLLTEETADAWPSTGETDLGNGYVLSDVDLSLGEEDVVLSADDPAGRRFLYGRWGELEGSGVWSSGRSTSIVFDVADALRGSDLQLTLTGARFADPSETRELRVIADDTVLARHVYSAAFAADELRVPISSELVEAGRGRVHLTLETPAPLSPQDLGQEDPRSLAYWLGSMSLRTSD
ncbi:hypothetical protein [Cellulomonas sp. Marseille-Q8402]